MCGEHLPLISSHSWPQGSSPHVRGAPATYAPDAANYGIIPACAGSTACADGTTVKVRDHPRMCGEHQNLLSFFAHFSGIIPACAGSTLRRPSRRLHSRGSSPHVRGARFKQFFYCW